MISNILTMTASSREEKQLAVAAMAAEAEAEAEVLIPGLPDELAEHCLLHLPFPYHTLARSVSTTWNRALTSAAFFRFKAAAVLVSPPIHSILFVFAYHRLSLRLHWQALDPLSRRWFLLPPIPLLATSLLCPSSIATAAHPSRGELYVLGGMSADTQTPLASVFSYSAITNSWSTAAPMPTPRSFFTAGAIDDRILAVGGRGAVVYEPAADRWATAADMPCGMARHQAAVMGSKMFVTEGWTWPFDFSPNGGVYDGESGTWEEMRQGMKEGWTGSSAVVGGRLFVVSEYGDRRVKVYEMEMDTWRAVDGGGVPVEVKRPYAVTGAENGKIYVAGKRLFVAVGMVAKLSGGRWKVEWEVVKGLRAMNKLVPRSAHVLYF